MEEELENFTEPSDYFKDFKPSVRQKKPKQTTNDDSLSSVLSHGAPIFRGFNTGVGTSDYDEGIKWDQDISSNSGSFQNDLEDYRSNNQPIWDKALKGVARIGTKAIAEVAKLPGVAVGIVDSAFVKDGEGLDAAFNNSWIKSIDSIQGNINEELLPVHVKKAVKEGNLWDNISSVDFWATEGADGAGYIAAMMVPGAIFEYAGLGGKLINLSSKASKYLGMSEKVASAANVLKLTNITGKAIDSRLAIMGNTIFEAGAESKSIGDDLDRKKPEFIKNYLGSKEHQVNSIKRLAELDEKRRSGQISIEEYNKLSLTVSEDLAEEKFKEQRALAMRDTFVSNIGILLGPNAMMHKAIWGKAGKTFVKETTDNLSKRVGKSLGRVGKAFASEGAFEEGSQTTVENMFVNKAMSGQLGNGNDFNVGDFAKEYVNTVSSTEGLKAIFLGGILGGPMMSYQGRREDLENRKQTNSVLDKIQSQITNFNDTFDNDIYKKDNNGDFIYKKNEDGSDTTERLIDNKKAAEVARSLNFTENQSQLFDQAIQDGNTKVVEDLKQQAIFNMILPAIHNGEMGIKALEQKLNEDSKFNEIVEKDKTADEKDKAKSFIKETLDTAKYLQKQNEKFQDFSKDVIELKNDKATSEQKSNFIERLNASYLNAKHELRNNEKSLQDLENKRSKIFEELDIDPLYDISSEFPVSKMKTGLISDKEMIEKAKKTKEAIESNPLLSKTESEYSDLKDKIKKSKKDISDIWNGKLIDESFNDFVDLDNKLEEYTSEENVQKIDDVINEIKNINNKKELTDYYSNLPKEIKDNHHIGELVQDQSKKINEEEEIQNQINRVQELEGDKEKFTGDAIFGTESKSDVSENVSDPISNIQLNSIQSSELPEVDSEDNEIKPNLLINVELDERTNPLNSSKNQGSSRIISTNQQTGEPLFDKLKDFVEYEKESRDKTKDKVTFDLGDINPKDLSFTANAIFERLKNGENITKDETKYLEDYLPIKVTLSNSGKSAFSFIDSMNSKSKEIVEVETLPLRKAIIEALVENKGDFEGIEGKVNKQFTGTLKLGEQNSNILDLDIFKGMSEEDKIKYFKKNTVYVSNKGEVKYTSNDVVDETKSLSSENKGEVFLKIPMINGEMFYLKLNVNRLTQEKAESVLDLITLRSNILNKSQEFTSEELEDYINDNLPNLKTEFDFIKRNNDSIDVTLERLINFVVYSQNTNAKTKLILGSDGTLVLGELLHKVNSEIPEWSGQLESYTYTTESLNNLNNNQKQAIVEYLKYKRHNVLITKDNSATFNNDDYLKYLLGINSDYSVLTTNAIVNEPTFQGYSNIYLNQSIENKNKSNKKEIVSEKTPEIDYENTEDLLASLNGQFGDDVVQVIKSEVKPESDIESKKAEIEKLEYVKDNQQPLKPLIFEDQYSKEELDNIEKKYQRDVKEHIDDINKQIFQKQVELKALETENNSEQTQIVKSENLQDIFKTSDAKTKAKIVIAVAKQLGMTDKMDSKSMDRNFEKLYSELKNNETLQKEIKKICGL